MGQPAMTARDGRPPAQTAAGVEAILGRDDGNNVPALAPGVVIGYDRNVNINTKLRKGGIEAVTVPCRTFARSGRPPAVLRGPIARDGI